MEDSELPQAGGFVLVPSNLLCCVCGYVGDTADPAVRRRWQMVHVNGQMVTICPRHLKMSALVIGGDGEPEARREFLVSLREAVKVAMGNQAHAKDN